MMARAAEIKYDEQNIRFLREFTALHSKAVFGVDLVVPEGASYLINEKSKSTFNVTLCPDLANNSLVIPLGLDNRPIDGALDTNWLAVFQLDNNKFHLFQWKNFLSFVQYTEGNGGLYQGMKVETQSHWKMVYVNLGWALNNQLLYKTISCNVETFAHFRGLKLVAKEDFVHLHAHSMYSLLDGVAPCEDLVEAAVMNGQPGLALTDHGYMYGIYKHWKACKDAGIKSLLGCEIYLVDDVNQKYKDAQGNDRRFEYHQTLIAMNQQGWENLCELISIAGRDHFYHVPRVDHNMLFKLNEGIICLSGCFKGPVAFHLQKFDPTITKDLPWYQYNPERSLAIMKKYKEVFGDRYYAEVHKNDFARYMECVPEICEMADRVGVPKVIAQDSHYAKTEDAEIQRLVTRVSNQKVDEIGDGSNKFGPYFITQISEMQHPLFTPDMFSRTCEIMERCTATLENKGYLFPDFKVEEDVDWKAYQETQV